MVKTTKKIASVNVADVLREKGFRATPIRKEALKILIELEDSLSIQELFDILAAKMRPKAPDWATVYRILNQFEETGIVFSFEAHGAKKYEYLDAESKHHHHLICRECDQIEHLSSCQTKVFSRMTQSSGFKDITHRLEFYGLCPACSD